MTTDAVERVTRLLEDRLDYYLVGGKGARERLPELAAEIVDAVAENVARSSHEGSGDA